MKLFFSFCRHGLLGALLIIATLPAVADTTNSYAGSQWAFIDAAKVQAAAADITPAKFPDCDDATVEKKMVRLYCADGTAEMQDESFVKVLTEKGKRGDRSIVLDFMLPYSTAEVAKLEVLKPDGTVVPVDVAANSKETIDDSQMSMNIYDPNSKLLQVNIPQLEIGDVVHAVTRQTILRPIMPGEFSDENVFEGDGYIKHLSYEVQAPAERPLQSIKLRDEVAGTIKYSTSAGEGGSTIHHWEVNNVPRMFEEPAMPPYEMVLQRLLVSTTPDWLAVSKWYWELSRPHLEATTPDMKQTVDDLTKDSKTDLEKVKAIFYYVSKKIRYMGLTPEKDRPGFEPHDVKITFGKKYGVCRDKAALLVSMLRAAGFNSYPVLISVGSKRDPDVADTYFNHAIVSVELKPREYTLMDPTDENTRELLPTGDSDQSFLVCRPEGEDLKVSPVQPPDDHLMRVQTTGTLSADGRLDAKSELFFGGVNDDEYRNMFSHLKPDDIRRFFERNLKLTLPGAKLKSLTLTPENMLDVSVPLRAELGFSVEGMTATGSGKAVVVVPWIGKHLGIVNFILNGTGLEKRKYPMRTSVACGLREDISLTLANDFTGSVSMPTCAPVDDESLDYQRQFSFTNGVLACSRELKLKVDEFSPAEYLKLKQTLKALDYDERKAPVLAMAEKTAPEASAKPDTAATPAVESNAEILYADKELDVTDAHTSTYHLKYSKRILNYAGKIREAEVKYEFNPATQDARIIRGVVTSKTGQRQEIATNEINVMDAGWNASAKRYTGGKVLVANLPGVDIGSTLEVELEITSKGRAFLAGHESFQMPDELDQKSFHLTAPLGVKIQKMVSGAAGIVRENSNHDAQQQTFDWHAEHVAALPAESSLPPEWVYSAGVDYFVGDLNSYLKDLNDALLNRSQSRAKTEVLVHQLTAQSKTKLEAVKAIRDYVAQSIRVAGPSFTDLPLSELSAADTTLADGYGHAADCAILLHAMLSAAGLQPEFVLASSLPSIPSLAAVAKAFPLPDSFQMPLVRVTVDGETYYLNDTDQYAQLGSTPNDGRLALVPATGNYEVIHAAKDCSDKMETDYQLTMGDDGRSRVQVTRQYFGDSFNGKKQFFSELPPEERRRYFQEMVSHAAQGARPVGDLTTHFDTYPGTEQFTVDIDNYSVVDGKYLYFDLPFTPSLLPVGSDRRALPVLIGKPSRNVIRTEIALPAGFRQVAIAPKNEQLDEPAHGGSARITTAQDAGKCVITDEFEITPAIIQPSEYPAMLRIESELGREASRVFLLERN
jgi:transglutaminase-like putative cysteine protease